MLRDFTLKSKNELLDLIETVENEKYCNFTDWIGDKWYSFEELIGELDINRYIDDINRYHKKVIDKNNTTKGVINSIFENVNYINNTYHTIFSTLYQYSLKRANLLKNLCEFIKIKNNMFDTSTIFYMENNSNEDMNEELHIDICKEYVKKKSKGYFSEFNGAISLFVDNVGLDEVLKMLIFNMFSITKNRIKHGDEYDKVITKEKLLNLFITVADAQRWDGSAKEQLISEASDYLKEVKKLGNGTYKYLNTHRFKTEDLDEKGRLLLDGRTKEAKKFRAFLDKLGNVEKILDYGDKGAEFLVSFFAEYQQAKEFLTSFKNNYGNDDPLIEECLKEIESYYNKELQAWFEETLQMMYEKGVDITMEFITKSVPLFVIVDKIGESIDLIGTITGVGPEAKSELGALEYVKLYTNIHEAYLLSYNKVENADPLDGNYDFLLKDLENCFNLEKETLITMFDKMANSCNGNKKQYYLYCKERAQVASMCVSEDGMVINQLSVLTYDEFIASRG